MHFVIDPNLWYVTLPCSEAFIWNTGLRGTDEAESGAGSSVRVLNSSQKNPTHDAVPPPDLLYNLITLASLPL